MLLPLLYSCNIETVTEVDIPQPQRKLVVYSFLTPEDSVIEVTVSKSVPTVGPLNNGNPDYVTDATVTLSDGTQSVALFYDLNRQLYYTKEMRPVAGRTYHLSVSTPAGLSVKANCTVPVKQNTSLFISLDSMKQTGDLPSDYFVRARWTDLPGLGDYYKVDFEAEFDITWTGRRFESLPPETPTASDEKNDGSLLKAESGTATSLGEGFRSGNLKKVNGYLLTCDYNYYKYHESLHRYHFTNTFTEPVRVFTNIEGGLGCFGAYQSHSVSIVP